MHDLFFIGIVFARWAVEEVNIRNDCDLQVALDLKGQLGQHFDVGKTVGSLG